MQHTLCTVEEVSAMIFAGDILLLAAEESLLARLPMGNWLGGTIPYFMSAERGGTEDHDHILVTRFPDGAAVHDLRLFNAEALPGFAVDGPANGFTIVLLPAFSPVHALYAENVSQWPEAFARPVAGWVAGVALDTIGEASPKVFDGRSGTASGEHAGILHISLPETQYANIDIINLFEQGDGDTIRFPKSGFTVKDAEINGQTRNLAAYIADRGIDSRLPLVANYSGAMINVSLERVDRINEVVHLYAPVVAGIDYRFANPVDDYTAEFSRRTSTLSAEPIFACNCILNYLYAKLEGQRTAHIVGPMTFGEIAYVLLNQTMVYLTIAERA